MSPNREGDTKLNPLNNTPFDTCKVFSTMRDETCIDCYMIRARFQSIGSSRFMSKSLKIAPGRWP